MTLTRSNPNAKLPPPYRFDSDPTMVGHGQYNTDKVGHGYVSTYLELVNQIRSARAVCEVGVQYGGSLAMWQMLLPHAKIVGVDIDEDSYWPQGTHKVVANQANATLPATLSALSPQYDMIVEDASHIVDLSVITWNNLWPLVAHGGFYVIEDWQVGFPGMPFHEELGRNWLPTVKDFIEQLSAPGKLDIESIDYRHGLIIFRKIR